MRVRQQIKRRARALARERGIGYARAQRIVAQEMWDAIPRRFSEIPAWTGPAVVLMMFYELADGRWHTREDLAGKIRRRHGVEPDVENAWDEFVALARSPEARALGRFQARTRDGRQFLRMRLPDATSLAARVEVMQGLVRSVLASPEARDEPEGLYLERRRAWLDHALACVRQMPPRFRVQFVLLAELVDLRWHTFAEVWGTVRAVYEPHELTPFAEPADRAFPGEAFLLRSVFHTRSLCGVPGPDGILRGDQELSVEIGWDDDPGTADAARFRLAGLPPANTLRGCREAIAVFEGIWRRRFPEWLAQAVREDAEMAREEARHV